MTYKIGHDTIPFTNPGCARQYLRAEFPATAQHYSTDAENLAQIFAVNLRGLKNEKGGQWLAAFFAGCI
jgi:hypothetical protein